MSQNILDLLSRLTLLVVGIALTVDGVVDGGLWTIALAGLGVAAIAAAAMLPTLERFRIFGPHGFEATLRSGEPVGERREEGTPPVEIQNRRGNADPASEP